ncbi:FAD-dependent oxidoreductase [soil metagenome]
MSLPNTSSPIWSRSDALPRPAMVTDRRADVVVVGAGIAGLTTALLLAREGLDVVVLEARTIGSGTTGHTTAKVSALQGTRYQALRQHHAPDIVRSYAQAQQAALGWMAATVAELDIDCAWERRPALTYATSPDSRSSVEAEATAALHAGLAVELTVDTGLPFPTSGAVRLDDQAQFDPQRYLEALAAEVERLPNASVHERTRVTGIRGIRSHVVSTDHATVRTPTVVVATLLPTVDRGLFFARAEPKMSYTIAVDVDGALPDGMYLSAGEPSRSLRTAWHGDRQVLVIGGAGHTVGRSVPTTPRYEELDRWAREHFPVRETTARWAAHDLVPDDQLPWAGPASPATPGVLVAGGFAKWGMTNGTAAAHVLADRILERRGPSAGWSSAYTAFRLPPSAISETARINLGVAANLVGGWARPAAPVGDGFEGPNPRRSLVPTGDSVGPTEELEPHDLVCTHLGGICAWNDAERTWDCPLHGSRFASDGTVVAAPAVRPLPRP